VRIFNRIVVILLLAGLFVLGVYAVVYSFDLFGYRLQDLPAALGLPGIYGGIQNFVQAVESGIPPIFAIAVLALIALLGLILLIAELKPPAPRRVRLDKNTYITRAAVEDEVVDAAEGTPEVLGSSARVKARRGPGAKVDVRADVRRGEDTTSVQSAVQNSVRERLSMVGVPVNSLKVRPIPADPRETKTRVK
jgi:hypothetical protein